MNRPESMALPMTGYSRTVTHAPTLAELQRTTAQINTRNGWWDKPADTIEAQVAALHLIVTEVAEATEELRAGRTVTEEYDTHTCPDATYTPTGVLCSCTPKPEGVPAELADVVIRCLDFAARHGINLEAAVLRKLTYNATRTHRHGGKTI